MPREIKFFITIAKKNVVKTPITTLNSEELFKNFKGEISSKKVK